MKRKLGKQIFKDTSIFCIYIFLLEMIVKINTHNSIIDWSTLRILIGSLTIGLLLGLFINLFNGRTKKIISTIIALILAVYAFAEINMYSYVGFFMGIGNAEQGTKIIDYVKDVAAVSSWQSYLIFIPLILLIVYIWWLEKFINRKKLEKTTIFVFKNDSFFKRSLAFNIGVIALIGLAGLYYISLNVSFMQNKLQSISNTSLLLSSDNSNLSVSQFGVFAYGLSDIAIQTFKIEENEIYAYSGVKAKKEQTDNTRYIDDTAWNYIIENENNSTYNKLNNYFINREITDKNEYTGIFKDKNLIVILMESTNLISINEKEYPTLYKMYSEGISFRNNYTPRNNCSTGNNEMTAMTSLFTINNTCTANKYKNNVYPEAVFNIFNNAGYITSSYHDYTEHYYYRKTIHPNMGSMAYYNVEDLGIKWNSKYEEWPSDVDLVEKATPKFIDEDKFMAFLTTVTPHQPYLSYSEYGDKHLSELSDYDYSKPVKRYMSKLKELDASLELLLEKLEEAGKLDDTVIALFCDHYPYGLTNSQINEVLDYDVRVNNEVDRTPMIIYNSTIEAKEVYNYTSIIDLLPTLLNMFDLEYDPRLYLGVDVMSKTTGRTVFADGSWQDEVGYYSSTTGKFKPINEDITYTDEELIEINNEITTRQKMSALAIKNNYFKYLNNATQEYLKQQEDEKQKELELENSNIIITESEEN